MINESWKRGVNALPLAEDEEMKTLSRALGILFASGENILKFYKLRRDLGMRVGDPEAILNKMRRIVENEIENLTRMATLAEKDKRLGYNSEAEGFKFFPKKLLLRAERLKLLLETEVPEIEERVRRGDAPLEFYLGKEGGRYSADAYFTKNGVGEWRELPQTPHRFKLEHTDNELTVKIEAKEKASVILGFELEPLVPTPTLSFGADGKLRFASEVYSHQSLFGNKIEKEISKYSLKAYENGDTVSYELKINRKSAGWTKNIPFRIRMKVGGAPLKKTKIGLRLLAKWEEYPDTHVWVIPES